MLKIALKNESYTAAMCVLCTGVQFNANAMHTMRILCTFKIISLLSLKQFFISVFNCNFQYYQIVFCDERMRMSEAGLWKNASCVHCFHHTFYRFINIISFYRTMEQKKQIENWTELKKMSSIFQFFLFIHSFVKFICFLFFASIIEFEIRMQTFFLYRISCYICSADK